jgi:LacI family transcriptional regulator
VAAAGAAYAPGGEDADALTPKGAPLISPTEIRRWLTSLPRPLGLFAGCDMWGRTLLRFCTEFGLQVPDDVALIGVDDDEVICETAFPTLSSVRVPWRRVGLEAAHLLHQLLEGGPPPSTVRVPPTGVHARRSSDGIAVTDPDVAAALRFIHANAHRRVSVPEILRHVPVGRHTLQRGFRRVLGRTILAEVRRVRVAAARQLLVSTSLSVEEIASLSGFPSADKFGKAFRAETGVTPSAYRLRHAPRGSR